MVSDKELEFYSSVLMAETVGGIAAVVFALARPEGLGQLDVFEAALAGVFFYGVLPLCVTLSLPRDPKTFFSTPRKHRFKQYAFFITIFLVGSGLFYALEAKTLVFLGIWQILTYALLYASIYFLKTSVHTAVVTGFVTLLVALLGQAAIALYALVLIAAYIRYRLKAHSIPELIVGVVVGFAAAAITLSIASF